ncbi:hypothetical protein M5D96_014142 [Drosophila gunungcola]|uniref:Uncharacterized protein n=1 Tax=Drosophila gunungcola TaxID=103775 RepID=A0A9P9YAR8_9MUSC|nr:hypothetical protein M5D96_014142 [Drosophila gunungcola]
MFAPVRAPTVNRGSEPTSLDTSPSRIPTIRRPSSIPTSRVPIRRLAGVPTRNTSPVRATPLEEVTSASACSLPLLLSSENTVADHELIQPSSRKEKSHHRVIELNKVRLLKLQHKKLENLQTELMLKIRTLAPQRLQGVYKFVAVVVNEKCKVESVHDLKERCRAVVDSKLRMHHRLEEAHVGPDKARHSIDKQLAQIAFLVGELKEARELIVNLQQRQDVMDKGVMEKDLVIAELNEKYRNTMMQISKLKEALNIKSIESETQSQVEGRLNKEITKLREKIDLDQQKLTARNHLINSLQKTEQENRAKLDKMYCQVGEKNTLISQSRGRELKAMPMLLCR